MAGIKKHDFIEIDYTGKMKDNGSVFDTTIIEVAKANNLPVENAEFGSRNICVGENQMLRGLEAALIGKEPGKYTINLAASDAFGKKDAKLLKLIPLKVFTREKIMPVPGLQVNIDGVNGTIRTAAGGRTLVDFNHPLAGKDIIYEVEIKRILEDKKDKLIVLMQMVQLLKKDYEISMDDNKAKVTLRKALHENSQVNAALLKQLTEKAKQLTGFADIEFVMEERKAEETPIVEKKARSNTQKTK